MKSYNAVPPPDSYGNFSRRSKATRAYGRKSEDGEAAAAPFVSRDTVTALGNKEELVKGGGTVFGKMTKKAAAPVNPSQSSLPHEAGASLASSSRFNALPSDKLLLAKSSEAKYGATEICSPSPGDIPPPSSRLLLSRKARGGGTSEGGDVSEVPCTVGKRQQRHQRVGRGGGAPLRSSDLEPTSSLPSDASASYCSGTPPPALDRIVKGAHDQSGSMNPASVYSAPPPSSRASLMMVSTLLQAVSPAGPPAEVRVVAQSAVASSTDATTTTPPLNRKQRRALRYNHGGAEQSTLLTPGENATTTVPSPPPEELMMSGRVPAAAPSPCSPPSQAVCSTRRMEEEPLPDGAPLQDCMRGGAASKRSADHRSELRNKQTAICRDGASKGPGGVSDEYGLQQAPCLVNSTGAKWLPKQQGSAARKGALNSEIGHAPSSLSVTGWGESSSLSAPIDSNPLFPKGTSWLSDRLEAAGRGLPGIGQDSRACGGPQSENRKKKFQEHWSPGEISAGIKNGKVFLATFRVNSHNRHEAYVTIDGVPVDFLLDGLQAQNRAMEGDIVVVRPMPSDRWPAMKGTTLEKEADKSKNGRCILEDLELELAGQGLWGSNSASVVEGGDTDPSLSGPSAGVQRPGNGDASCENALLEAALADLCLRDQEDNGVGKCCPSNKGGEEDPLERPRKALAAWCTIVRAWPMKRPTAEVVAIFEKSSRRERIVGYLEIPDNLKDAINDPGKGQRRKKGIEFGAPVESREGEEEKAAKMVKEGVDHMNQVVVLVPSDLRFPKMLVFVSGLPDGIKKRLFDGDTTLPQSLVAARVDCWKSTSVLPLAVVRESLGQAGEIETETAAIMFQHDIHGVDFPEEALCCLPPTPWSIPMEELAQRRDFRLDRVFSIDPPTARDLDDALSVQRLPGGNLRVGVHIADVSFFIPPGCALDLEARRRSTSVYLIQRVLPMLPPLLCEELCSLNPGVDRLAFSVVWDLTPAGDVVDRWVGRSVIRTCAKLAYGHAQQMIDGSFDAESGNVALPQLHGGHTWEQVAEDVLELNDLARKLRERRFASGALKLDRIKLMFAIDEDGNPYDAGIYEHTEANSLVEEFMLFANRSVAFIISSAFPDSALLRRHPSPNSRKLVECEEFCKKHNIPFDSTSAATIHESLENIRERVGRGEIDSSLYEIVMLYASRPMQLAKYFCTGELPETEEWCHYALATPLYTHFTSPIRRYPDLIVHRMLASALQAEELIAGMASAAGGSSRKAGKALTAQLPSGATLGVGPGKAPILRQALTAKKQRKGAGHVAPGLARCFSGMGGGASAQALKMAAETARTCGLMRLEELKEVAKHCNDRKLDSKSAQEASDKVYLCVLLQRRQGVVSKACVMSLGPKFMSVYVTKFGFEKRIYFDDIAGVKAEYFQSSGTLILELDPMAAAPAQFPSSAAASLSASAAAPSNRSRRKGGKSNLMAEGKQRGNFRGRQPRSIGQIVTVIHPGNNSSDIAEVELSDSSPAKAEDGEPAMSSSSSARRGGRPLQGPSILDNVDEVEPAVFPLTLQMFSTIPVTVDTIGGGTRALDIGVKLYMSSYFASADSQ